jgi:hypothetical protein
LNYLICILKVEYLFSAQAFRPIGPSSGAGFETTVRVAGYCILPLRYDPILTLNEVRVKKIVSTKTFLDPPEFAP